MAKYVIRDDEIIDPIETPRILVEKAGAADTVIVRGAHLENINSVAVLMDGYGDKVVVESDSQISAHENRSQATDRNGVGIRIGEASDDASGGNTVRIDAGGAVFGAHAAVVSFGDGSTIRNAGLVAGELYGLEVHGDAATIVNSGQVQSGSGSGIVAFDDDATILNSGIVRAETSGVKIDRASDFSVANSGLVMAGVGIEVEGENGSIENSGFVTASGMGVILRHSDGIAATPTGHSEIVNSGQIVGGTIGVLVEGGDVTVTNEAGGLIVGVNGYGVALGSETGGGLKLVNDGVIQGDTAVFAHNGADVVINRGAIRGDVELGAGADVYKGEKGVVTGVVDGGAGADTLFGGAGAERLFGGIGADVIKGGGGSDVLSGGAGSDILTGGGGADTFLFDAGPKKGGVDTITDFKVGVDTIAIDNAMYAGVGSDGALSAGRFHVGSAAADAGDRLIYDRATGSLFYDPDGSGSGAAVEIARLEAGLKLTAADFEIV